MSPWVSGLIYNTEHLSLHRGKAHETGNYVYSSVFCLFALTHYAVEQSTHSYWELHLLNMSLDV
jgi:hypothetical protein